MGSIMLNGISYTSGGADVEANPQDTPSDTLSTIGIDGVVYEIEGGGGGSDVAVDPTITSGTKIADITVDGDTSSLYAPEVSLTYAEYMALTEQEKNNGTTYYITDMDAGKVNIFAPVIYSKYEKQIGTWIDDKPLYQKTMTYQFANANDVYYDFVPDVNAYVVNAIGLIDAGGGGYTRPIPIFYNNSVSSTHARFDEGSPVNGVRLRRESGAWGASPTAIVTLQYTKTTDIEGSGLYNSLGVPMVHYTTDEQVVGTYLGETLYEKTFTNITLSTSGQSFGGYYAAINATNLVSNATNIKFIRGDYEVANTRRDWVSGMYEPESNTFYLLTTDSRSNVVSNFTIQYTKST